MRFTCFANVRAFAVVALDLIGAKNRFEGERSKKSSLKFEILEVLVSPSPHLPASSIVACYSGPAAAEEFITQVLLLHLGRLIKFDLTVANGGLTSVFIKISIEER